MSDWRYLNLPVEGSANYGFRNFAYGNGLYVLIEGGSSASPLITWTSPDGDDWTFSSHALSNETGLPESMIYANGLFVVLCTITSFDSNPRNCVATSPDGLNWTARALPQGGAWRGLVWTGSQFIASRVTGEGQGTTLLATSPNGTTWSNAGAGPGEILSMATDGTTIVGTGFSGAIWTSTDNGGNWTPRTAPTAGHASTVKWLNNQFIALCHAGGTSTQRIWTSPNGITWTARTTPTSSNCQDVAYKNGKYIVVKADSSDSIFVSTNNGVTWTSDSSGQTAINDEDFVAVIEKQNSDYFLIANNSTGINNISVATDEPSGSIASASGSSLATAITNSFGPRPKFRIGLKE
jgi:hypothetical protein